MRKAGQALHRLTRFLLLVPLLLGAAVGALVWRLSAAPLETSLLARAIERSADGAFAPLTLGVARASLSWQGFRDGTSPLLLRVAGARLTDPEGREVARLPDGTAALAIGALLRGLVSPVALDLEGAELSLTRLADGSLTLAPPADAPVTPEQESDVAESRVLATLLRDLMAAPEERAAHTALRRLRIRGGTVAVRDLRQGLDWRLSGLEVGLQRLPLGGLEGDGEARLTLASPAAAAPLTLPVHLSARAEGRPARIAVRVDLPLIRPSDLAPLLPPLAPLSVLDAEVGLQLRFGFDATGAPDALALALQAPRGGTLRPVPGFAVPFAGLEAELSLGGERLVLEGAALRLPGEAGARVEASGALAREGAGWSGPLDLLVTDLDLARIPELWPAELAPEAREAARLALQAGVLRRGALRMEVAADAALEAWRARSAGVRLLLVDARFAAPGLAPFAVEEASLQARASPERIGLEAGRVVLAAPGPGAPAPRLDARGELLPAEGGWAGALELGLDRTRFQDLPALWPEGLGEGARRWILANVTEGEITDGRWRFGLAFEAAAGRLRLDALEGEAAMTGGVVHFLRPMPPVREVAARARFGRDLIALEASAGRLSFGVDPARGAIALRGATLRFALLPPGETDTAEMAFDLAGPLVELAAALRHPRLRLFERRPFPVSVAGGNFEGRLTLGLPLVAEPPLERLRLGVQARAGGARLQRLLFERDLEEGAFEVTADLDQLRLAGGGALAGIPLRYQMEADFRSGAPAQVVMRDSVTARATAEQLAALGLDAGSLLAGPVAVEARGERRRNGQGGYQLTLGLQDAAMAFPPLAWRKAPGVEARAEASLRLAGEQLTSIEAVRLTAPELSLRGRVALRAGRIERVEIQESAIGGSRFMGDARAGARPGEPWSVTLRGPVMDLRPLMTGGSPRDGPGPATQPPLVVDLRFDQVLLGPQRELFVLQASGRLDGQGVLRQASLRGRTARNAGAFDATISPAAGASRRLTASAEDGGALLRALDLARSLEGGRLTLNATFADSRPGASLSGTAELESFVARDAPAVGKLLQAITVFGILDALQGGSGLSFQRAVLPFTLTPETLRIEEARAFSASLGLTARGRVHRESGLLDLEGTIVPAYVLNTLLGNLPLVGRLFSPETGGGVFAASFRVRGPADDPEVSVNPLAAVTPGFLRGLFGAGQEAAGGARR